jgi:hypothetical protein
MAERVAGGGKPTYVGATPACSGDLVITVVQGVSILASDDVPRARIAVGNARSRSS